MGELRVIAKRVDGEYLIAINDTDGFVVLEHGEVISPIMMYDALIKFGYWEETDKHLGRDLKVIYSEALKLSISAKIRSLGYFKDQKTG